MVNCLYSFQSQWKQALQLKKLLNLQCQRKRRYCCQQSLLVSIASFCPGGENQNSIYHSLLMTFLPLAYKLRSTAKHYSL